MQKINHLLLITLLCHATAALAEQVPTSIFQEARSGNAQAIKERLEEWQDCSAKDENGNTALHIAAQKGHTEIVDMLTTEQKFLEWDWNYLCSWVQTPAKLPNKNGKNNDGNTPLHCSIEAGQEKATECLLQKNVDTNICNNQEYVPSFMILAQDNPTLIPLLKHHNCLNKKVKGNTVLHVAIKQNKPHIVERLLDEQSLVHEKDAEGKTITTIALDASNIPVLNTLIKKNINLNEPDKDGQRPMHHAARDGKYDILNFLLEHKISHNVTDKEGNTPLHYTAMYNRKKEMDLLLAHTADIQQCNNAGEDIFLIAVDKKHIDLVEYLAKKPGININIRDKKGQTAFMRTTIAQDYTGSKKLYDLGVNLRLTDYDQENVLHKAAALGNEDITKLVLSRDKTLLEIKNKHGETPLFVAVKNGRYAISQALIQQYGASINSTNNNGENPLFVAIAKGYETSTKILLQAGASVNTKNKFGETPLLVAVKNGRAELVTLLTQQYNAPVNITSNNGSIPLFIAVENGYQNTTKALLKAGASLLTKNKEGESILHVAAQLSDTTILSDLLNQPNKPDINILNSAKLTPLHCAAQSNNVAGIKLLEQHGAGWNYITPQGNTIAHSAIEKNAVKALDYIITRDPQLLNIENKSEHTPLLLAAKMNALSCAKKALREKDFINKDIERAINIAIHFSHPDMRHFLESEITDRKNRRRKIGNMYHEIDSIISDNRATVATLVLKNIMSSREYNPGLVNHYTDHQLYHMTETEIIEVHNYYLERKNKELQYKNVVTQRLNTVLQQEAAQREAEKELKRIARERERAEEEARLQRIEDQKRRERELKEKLEREALQAQRARELEFKQKQLAEEQARLARIEEQNRRDRELREAQEKKTALEAQKARELEFKQKQEAEEKAKQAALKAQQDEIDRRNKEKAAQDAWQADMVRKQKEVTAAIAADKERARQQQHSNALEGQHIPQNLQPSAPPMENITVEILCSSCGKKASAKPLPCNNGKCRKKTANLCNDCLKQHNKGQCPTCWNTIGKFTQKEIDQCCICTEKQSVTPMPCNNCKIGSARICKECLGDCLQSNPHKCPTCMQDAYNKDLIEKVLNQK